VSASFLASNLVFFIEADYYFILAEAFLLVEETVAPGGNHRPNASH
jgi:hypothetical protein